VSATRNGCHPVTSVSASATGGDACGRADHDIDLEPAAVLRRLIDEANASGSHLQALMERARRRDAGSAQASVRLQERLRLGAKMLCAFQAQIDRVEETIAVLRAQQGESETAQRALLEQLAALERRVEGLAAMAERATGRSSDLQALSHRAARANQRLSRTLAALDRRSQAARAVLEGLARRLEET
jgi:chromosome segregation ATPase